MGNQKADFGLANFENGYWTAKWKCLVNPLIMSLEFKGQLKDGDFHLNHQIFCVSFGLVELDEITPFSDSQPWHTCNPPRKL